ncbi:MAG: SulP family inorganic anion transporter [Vulcanimicrobiota bacterium]
MSPTLPKITNNPKADLFGGLTAAVTALPLAIAFGVMVTAPLGPEWSSVGAVAGLYGAIFTGFCASAFGGTSSQVTGPTGPMSTVLAGIVATFVARFGARLSGEEILLAAFLSVALAGLFQIALGLLRFGGLVRYIPYPVTAGFMNGIAVIIFLSQCKPFVGAEDGTIDTATTLIGLLTVAVIMVTPKVTKAVPGSLVGLTFGTALYYLVHHLVPDTALGRVVGEVPTAIPSLKNVPAFLAMPSSPIFTEIFPLIITAAISLSLLGAIDSLLTSLVADTVVKTRHDSDQELIGQGIGNAVSGCFGGLAGAGATIRTLVNIDAGGRGKLSGMFHSICLLTVVLLIGSTAGKIPNVVLSAILMVTAWGMIDTWSSGLLKKLASAAANKKEVAVNLALVAVVTVVTVVVDLMVAVALGLVLASLYFVGKSSATVIRGIYTAETLRSRRVYPHRAQEVLAGHGLETLVVELQGPLFFGSADRFSRAVEDNLKPETQRVILDLHRTTGIDSSGGRAIALLQETISASGRKLAVAGLPKEGPQWSFLQDLGVIEAVGPAFFFQDRDRALEWSEVEVLKAEASADGAYHQHALKELELFADFGPSEFEAVRSAMTEVDLNQGDFLFRVGDPGDSLFIITAGAVHLFLGDQPDNGRLSHFGPGAVIGEVSMLMNETRQSSAVVDLPLKAFCLNRDSLEQLQRQHPQAAGRLLWMLGGELAERIRLMRRELHAVEA